MQNPIRIPGDTAVVSDDYAEHRARGSAGGTDFVDPPGTLMRAMHHGVVVAVDNSPSGSGGRMVVVRCSDGSLDVSEELHALSITVGYATWVEVGQGLGISGGSGFGQDDYYGGHIHVHGTHPDGTRFNLEPYFNWNNPTLAGTAGQDVTPIEPEKPKPKPKGNNMAILFIMVEGDPNAVPSTFRTTGGSNLVNEDGTAEFFYESSRDFKALKAVLEPSGNVVYAYAGNVLILRKRLLQLKDKGEAAKALTVASIDPHTTIAEIPPGAAIPASLAVPASA